MKRYFFYKFADCRRHNHLSGKGELNEPKNVCSSDSCSLKQTVPCKMAGTRTITNIEDATSPDCLAILVDCDQACPKCDSCSKVEDEIKLILQNLYF